uniref:Ovule protein n=1 Tax=Brugia timori TaxID=42155 RepID=A0A0R3Q3H0_9BILA
LNFLKHILIYEIQAQKYFRSKKSSLSKLIILDTVTISLKNHSSIVMKKKLMLLVRFIYLARIFSRSVVIYNLINISR